MRDYRGIALLILASLVVAVAIVADGQLARSVNGVGGVLWIGATVFLIRHVRADSRFGALLSLTGCITLVLVLLTRPSDYLSATIGFAIAGAVVAFAAKSQSIFWSAMVPALWLPVHLGVAVIKVLERSIRDRPASVRTDPPPTSAFVPFVMVIAAILGGFVIQSWRARESASRLRTGQEASKVS